MSLVWMSCVFCGVDIVGEVAALAGSGSSIWNSSSESSRVCCVAVGDEVVAAMMLAEETSMLSIAARDCEWVEDGEAVVLEGGRVRDECGSVPLCSRCFRQG